MTDLHWNLDFPAPALDIWSVLADTDGFNRAAGLDFQFERVDGKMQGKTTVAGITSRWVETPIEWQTPNHFESLREYDSGPVRSALTRCTLTEHSTGTRVDYRVQLEPRNVLMKVPVALLARSIIRPGLDRALTAAGAAIRGEIPTFDPPPSLDDRAMRELEGGLDPIETPVAEALRRRILHAPLPIQYRMRSLQIAHEEGLDPEDVTRECVLAATAGALRMELQILCPRCRGAHQRSALLELEATGIHCPTCDIRYDGYLGENMEVVFGPGETVRPDAPPVDCIFSPLRTPHILVQLHLKAQAVGRFDATLEPGGYRLESPGADLWIVVDPDTKQSEVQVDLSATGFSPRGLRVAPGVVSFVLRNRENQAAIVALHSRWRPPHTLSVAQMFTWPSVREALPEGLSAGVRSRIEPGFAMVVEGSKPILTRAQQLLDEPPTRVYGSARALWLFSNPRELIEACEELARAHLPLSIGIARGAVVAMERGNRTDWGGPAVELALETMRSLGRPRTAIEADTLGDPEMQQLLEDLGDRVKVAEREGLPALLAFSSWFDAKAAPSSTKGTATESPSGSGAPSAPEGPILPDQIGRFKVLRELDRGGMGEVFEVVDPLGERWALKRIITRFEDPAIAQLFYKECYYASMLRHPNAVEVVDWGEHDGRPFLVMEVLVGESLAKALKKRRRLPIEEVGPVLLGLLDGLSAVHDAGLVHRDIKPGNVFLCASPTPVPYGVKLLDFGLMRRAGEVASDGLSGTPDYMAPEQLLRESQDPRTDVFAVGALAYRMLSGKRAWRGDTLGERVIQRVGTRPSELNWHPIPDALHDVLTQALEPNPSKRFKDARAMRDALAQRLQ